MNGVRTLYRKQSPAFLSSLESMINFKEIFSVTLILFSVIDILGSIPVVINILTKERREDSSRKSHKLSSALLMVGFLYLGQSILNLFGLDVASFAVAGAIVHLYRSHGNDIGDHTYKR